MDTEDIRGMDVAGAYYIESHAVGPEQCAVESLYGGKTPSANADHQAAGSDSADIAEAASPELCPN